MISELFTTNDICVFEGGEETVSALLTNKFNHILYTGGAKVGQIVMEKALLRNLITLSHHIAKEAYDAHKEVSDILDNVEVKPLGPYQE